MCFVLLQAGLRRLPDAGPDLSARRLSDFSLDLSVSNPVSTISKQSVTVYYPFALLLHSQSYNVKRMEEENWVESTAVSVVLI